MYKPLGVGVVIPPWNFPLAIHRGHDRRRDRHWQHRDFEAGQLDADRRGPDSSSCWWTPGCRRAW